VAGSIVIPAASDAASRVKVSVCSGMSGSIAVAVKVNVACSSTTWSPIGSSTGVPSTDVTVSSTPWPSW
jgi:hypothetical protein